MRPWAWPLASLELAMPVDALPLVCLASGLGFICHHA